SDHAFDARELRRLFAKVRYQPRVVAAMSRPVLARPRGFDYAAQFLNAARVDAGFAFLRGHEAVWRRADRDSGVLAGITVGSVGNFLARHDWQPGQPVIAAAVIELDAKDTVLGRIDGGMSERRSLDAWARDGVSGFDLAAGLAPDPVGLLMLEEAGGPSYWL